MIQLYCEKLRKAINILCLINEFWLNKKKEEKDMIKYENISLIASIIYLTINLISTINVFNIGIDSIVKYFIIIFMIKRLYYIIKKEDRC